MPTRAMTAGLAMLVMFTSLFGAAVAVVRRREEGLLEKLRLTPVPRALVACDLVLAGALVDVLQTGPVLVLFACVHATRVGVLWLPGAAACFVAAVLLLNLLGLLLAVGMRSNQEVHLAGALSVGAVAFLSGLFPVPDRVASLVGVTAAWSPVAWLTSLLGSVAGDAARPGAAILLPAVVTAGIALLLIALRAIDWPGPAGRR